MTDANYYEDVFGYSKVNGYYTKSVFFMQAANLMKDLEKNFAKAALGSAEAKELQKLALSNIEWMDKTDLENRTRWLLLAKQIDQPRWIVTQGDTSIVFDKPIQYLNLQLAMPARGPGSAECYLEAVTGNGATSSLPLNEFAGGLFEYRHADRFFNLTSEIKHVVDFLRVPWKMHTFNDV